MTAPAITASVPKRGITRDQLIQLGQAGRPWEFVPLGIQAIRAMPQDHALRFVLAANFARLGLVSAAREQLGQLPDHLHADPDVMTLCTAIDALPSDTCNRLDRVAQCRTNVEALKSRGIDLAAAFAHWTTAQSSVHWLRATDGNIVRRRGTDGSWELLGDHLGLARRFVADRAAALRTATKPIYVEGSDPPWLLIALAEATPRHADGFQPAIHVIQADMHEFLDGLALADLANVFADPRIKVWVGERACPELTAHLSGRLAYTIAGDAISLPTVRSRLAPAVAAIVADAESEQVREVERLHTAASNLYASRDRIWWARRFGEAIGSNLDVDRALRVLIPTSRYSTFVKHSSTDLAAALNRRGIQARLLSEPDDQSRLSSVAYLQAIVDFNPDLILTINYTRANINGDPASPTIVPLNIPFVCWIQDAMSHLFDPGIGRRQTELDFVVGHVFPELAQRYEYPESQTLRCSAGADLAKFHDAAPAPHLLRRFECEVAYVSNHAEPPDALRERLGVLLGSQFIRAESAIIQGVETEVRRSPDTHPPTAMQRVVEQALTETFHSAHDQRIGDILTRQFAEPYADRLIRHDTLAWAAEIAERRGWRLKIYGRGWSDCPAFARFAAGEIAHGEELRTAYHAAGVHLQMTVHTLVHQRVFECLMSGGFPICRLNHAEFQSIHTLLFNEATRKPLVAGASAWPLIRHRLARFEDNPELGQWASVMCELGLFEKLVPEICGERIGIMLPNGYFTQASPASDTRFAEEYSAFCHLGRRAEHFFHSPQTLESRIAFALEHPEARRSLSRASAERARARKSYDALLDNLIPFVTSRLSGGHTR